MAFPQIKTPLPLTVRKRQRRKNSSAVPLLLPVQSPAPQCASNNARPVITGACRSRLLGRRCRPFSRKARRGSSHGHPALPCTIRQLSAAFFPGTLSRHSRIFHCPAVYSSAKAKSRDEARRIFHLVCIRDESGSGKGCDRTAFSGCRSGWAAPSITTCCSSAGRASALVFRRQLIHGLRCTPSSRQ